MAADAKVQDMIRKLINLAASSNLSEASGAAYKACQLIRRHGMEVIDPTEMDALLAEAAELKLKVKQLELDEPEEDEDNATFQGPIGYGHPSTFQGPSYFATVATMPASAFGGSVASRNTPPPSSATMPAPRQIVSAFNGKCTYCKGAYGVGESILWQKNVGQWCAFTDCYAAWRALQNFNPTAPFGSPP